jgi:chorismate synthase
MPLQLVTAGESHGPALLAVITGLPAGLELDRERIDHDLWRRQQGYGRSPRQQIETDKVEVLTGLRHGRTLGSPLTLMVRNSDHKNWTWGMSPWPPEGEPHGKGAKAVVLPRPGHADLAAVMKYEYDDVRNALERASARHTAANVAAGGVAKALLGTIGVTVSSQPVEIGGVAGDQDAMRAAMDKAKKDTLGGVVELRVDGLPPGLGSYVVKEERLDARIAWALMGIQAVKSVEIGDGLDLARRPGSLAHDEIYRDDEHGFFRRTNRAGGLEAGITNGEQLVVRCAMKPIPTLMKPLDSVDLSTGQPSTALVERSDTAAVEAMAVIAEAALAFELAAAAKAKFGGDAIGDFVAAHAAYLARIDWRRS